MFQLALHETSRMRIAQHLLYISAHSGLKYQLELTYYILVSSICYFLSLDTCLYVIQYYSDTLLFDLFLINCD